MAERRYYVLDKVTRNFIGDEYSDMVTIREKDDLVETYDIVLELDDYYTLRIKDYADFQNWLLNTPVHPPEDGEVPSYQWLEEVVNEYEEELEEERRFVQKRLRRLARRNYGRPNTSQ